VQGCTLFLPGRFDNDGYRFCSGHRNIVSIHRSSSCVQLVDSVMDKKDYQDALTVIMECCLSLMKKREGSTKEAFAKHGAIKFKRPNPYTDNRYARR